MTKNNYHMNDADELLNKGEFLLDVRETFEYELGHIESSKHISLTELEQRINELPKDKTIYTYCKSGRRSQTAADLLNVNGFDAISLEGGFSSYTGKFSSTDTEEVISPVENNSNIDDDRIMIAAHGLQCPGPLLKVNEVMNGLETGKQMEITVTDQGFCTDVEAWAKKHGHAILKMKSQLTKLLWFLKRKHRQQLKGTRWLRRKTARRLLCSAVIWTRRLRHSLLRPVQRAWAKK